MAQYILDIYEKISPTPSSSPSIKQKKHKKKHNSNLESSVEINNKSRLDVLLHKSKVFFATCMNGHVDVTNWMLQLDFKIALDVYDEFTENTTSSSNHNNNDYDDNSRNNGALNANNSFYFVCFNGYLEMAKWMHEVRELIDMQINLESALLRSLSNKQFELADWLISAYQKIHHLSDRFYEINFSSICMDNDFDIAEWIYRRNPHAGNNAITHAMMSRVCLAGHYKMAQWLYTIKPLAFVQQTSFKVYFMALMCSISKNNAYKLPLLEWILNFSYRHTPRPVFDDTYVYDCLGKMLSNNSDDLHTIRWFYNRFALISNVDLRIFNNALFLRAADCNRPNLRNGSLIFILQVS